MTQIDYLIAFVSDDILTPFDCKTGQIVELPCSGVKRFDLILTNGNRITLSGLKLMAS